MNFKTTKASIQKRILNLIEEGSEIRDKIEKEYHEKRINKSFNPEVDIIPWNKLVIEWYEKCLRAFDEIFTPAIFIRNRFKNPKTDGLYPSGENIKWASIMKNINVRLDLLDVLYQNVNAIEDEKLSDYFESGIPIGVGKIKFDRILDKFISWIEKR